MNDTGGHPHPNQDPCLVVEELWPRVWKAHFTEIRSSAKHNLLQAEYFRQRMDEIFKQHPDGTINFLIIAPEGKSGRFVSKKARQNFLRLYMHPRVDRVAFVGLTRWLSAMVRIFTQVSGRWDTSRVFKSKEEAIAWLQQGTRQGTHTIRT